MWKQGDVVLKEEDMEILATELGEESCLPDLLGESILQNELEFQLGEEDEIYQGYGRIATSFPYRQYNAYDSKLRKKSIKTMVLENKYLKATFLPELGGRLWSLIDKDTGKNLLYTNDVLQLRNLAVRNAWFSGGVEWNIGVIGHTPFTTDPLYVAVAEDELGCPILRMYEYERVRKVFYQMDFWLEEHDKFLNCRMRIVNENEHVVPMYWWSNIAVPEFDGGRILVPANKAYTITDKKVLKVDIPMVDGVDVTQYGNIPKSVDYFFEIEEQDPKFIANVDSSGYGLLQLSTSRLKSRKLFSWGHLPASRHWQEFLTKEGGAYLEIQAGLAKTQYGCLPMSPHTAWEWVEQYGPVQLSVEELKNSHEESSRMLGKKLIGEGRYIELEEKLKQRKALAKTPAHLLRKGSGYGAMAVQGEATSHLAFLAEKESLKKWRAFKDTRILHQPSPKDRPDEFWAEEALFRLLEETAEGENRENWYAHYQLGIYYCMDKHFKKAKKELKKSFALEKNPWACHGLGCICFMEGNNKKGISWILKGLSMEKENISYLKDGFKLLSLCGGHQELKSFYEQLSETHKRINRLKFYYISAKYQLGQYQEAYELLEADGGLELEDIREGEDSVENLWKQLSFAVFGEEREVPYQYSFHAF